MTADCPQPGSGGFHSESYGDGDGGACAWCGARPAPEDPMTIEKKLVSETVTPHYFVREELQAHCGDPENWTRITAAYSFAGDLLGSVEEAGKLVEFGITHFEKTRPDHCVCSIGFNPAAQKWFGWSHRAITCYGIGDVVEAGSCPTQSGYVDGYLEEHPEDDCRVPAGFKVKTLDDAKRVATAFAMSVS